MIDYMEMLKNRRVYLEGLASSSKAQLASWEKEIKDIKFVEDTLKAEKEICICRHCDGTGKVFESGEKIGSVNMRQCEHCGGKGYTGGK